jgi:hypothetical protein
MATVHYRYADINGQRLFYREAGPRETPPKADASNRFGTPAADKADARTDAFAVSPAIGPLPAIYVPRSPSPGTGPGLLWHAAILAGGRIIRFAGGRLRACFTRRSDAWRRPPRSGHSGC